MVRNDNNICFKAYSNYNIFVTNIVQNVRLPPLNILDEGDEVVVYIEKDEQAARTSEKPLRFMRSGGDMTTDFDEDISINVTMKKSGGGEYLVSSTNTSYLHICITVKSVPLSSITIIDHIFYNNHMYNIQ